MRENLYFRFLYWVQENDPNGTGRAFIMILLLLASGIQEHL